MNRCDRRRFLDRAASGALAAGLATRHALAAPANQSAGRQSPPGMQIAAFTKSFQDRPVAEVARMFKRIGLDGLDLTVRPGGHIDPADAKTKLPAAAAAVRGEGLEILFLTTAITAADPAANELLAVAAEQGIDRVKLGYYRYREFGQLADELDDVRRQLAAVARMAARHKVLPCVHIHSGSFLPSHGTQLYLLLKDFAPDELGAYVDPLHMTLEGGRDGWRQGLDLLAPWIAISSVKNFAYVPGERAGSGQRRWHTQTVPVADGICPIPEYVAALDRLGFRGPYSLHSEYKGGHSFKSLDTDGCLAQTKADLEFFRPLVE